jgi:hypothetical protein
MKRMVLAAAVALGVLLLALCDAPTATVFQRKTLTDLLVDADLVAIGRVVGVESRPTADGRYAYTYVTVDELELLKGVYRDPTLVLRMDGGPLGDGTVLAIPGIPSFQAGEKVVAFIEGNGRYICPFVGWEQGALRVLRDTRTGRDTLKTSDGRRIHGITEGDFVVEAMSHHAATEPSPGIPDYGQAHERSPHELTSAAADLSLDSFKRDVQGILANAGPRALPKSETRSADLKLDSPGLRLDRTSSPRDSAIRE